MKVKFWGVRGSIPAPPTNDQIKTKIKHLLNKIAVGAIESSYDIDSLVEEYSPVEAGLIGGNTSCVEVRAANRIFIFDMGSGIRNLGNHLVKYDQKSNGLELHIFLSHTHWDHIHGFPFFTPAFYPNNKICFYAVHPKLQERLEYQQDFRFFPVSLDNMKAQKEFIQLKPRASLKIGEVKITNSPLYHPGGSYGYRVEHENKVFVYASDSEYKELSKSNAKKYIEFFRDADLLVFDAQYTFEEAIHKEDWGHSSALVGIDFATQAKVKRLALFHHEPERDDFEIQNILVKSLDYFKINYPSANLDIFLATEGLQLQL